MPSYPELVEPWVRMYTGHTVLGGTTIEYCTQYSTRHNTCRGLQHYSHPMDEMPRSPELVEPWVRMYTGHTVLGGTTIEYVHSTVHDTTHVGASNITAIPRMKC